jgi:hypothetical protein
MQTEEVALTAGRSPTSEPSSDHSQASAPRRMGAKQVEQLQESSGKRSHKEKEKGIARSIK